MATFPVFFMLAENSALLPERMLSGPVNSNSKEGISDAVPLGVVRVVVSTDEGGGLVNAEPLG